MKLSRIEVSGFKSFRERTGLELDDGITAVVGPNGCGKSNIVDAVRWALGEQRARALRGGKMTDVIFAGSDAAKPVGMADVKLTFEVEPDELPAPWHRQSEVVIGRRLYRSGESVYSINKEPCRLKDIHVLLLGTGAGETTYSIVSQGTVGRVVTARPSERRALIEEAAGISRYKHQRALSERNLTATEQNLERVADLLDEVGRQVRSLRQQAARAERYERLRLEEETLGIFVWVRERAELLATLREERANERKARTALEDHRRSGADLEASSEALQIELFLARQRRDSVIEESVKAEARMQLLEGGIKHTRRERARISDQLESLAQRLATTGHNLEADRTSLDSLEREMGEMEVQAPGDEALLTARDGVDDARRLLAGLETRRKTLERSVREQGREMSTLEARAAAARSEREAIAHRRDRLRARRLDVLEAQAGATARIAELKRKEHAVLGELAELEDEHDALTTSRDALSQELLQSRQKVAVLDTDILKREARYEALLAVDSGPVTSATPLAALLDVPAEHIRSVAGILGSDLDAGWVSRPHELQDENTGSRFALAVARTLEDPLPLGIEIVDPDARDALGSWLSARFSRVEMVSDVRQRWMQGERPGLGHLWGDDAGWTLDDLGVLRRYVSPEGQGILERTHARRELRQDLSGLKAQRATLDESLQQSEGQMRDLEARIDELDEALSDERRRARELERARESAQLEMRDVERQLDDLDRSDDELADDTRKLAARGIPDEDALSALRSRLEEEEQALVACDTAIEAQRVEITRASEALQALELEQVRAASEQRAAELALSQLRDRVRSLNNQALRLADERTKLLQRASELETTEQEEATQLEALETRVRETSAARGEVEVAVAELEARRQAIAAQELERRASIEALERKRHAAELAVERASATLVALDEQSAERYGTSSDAAAQRLQEHPVALTLERARETLGQARQRLKTFGEVNTGAVRAYQEAREREDELTRQVDDLSQAVSDLRAAIRRIDRDCEARFRETFDAVNQRFQEVFPQLFGGGRAKLTLTDPEDLLGTGVDITAQPPGKRPQTLSLLSGGEKAMTASALMMALFLLRPAPFCILDEVDAPLDDINVARFCRLLTSLAQHSQLLVVTHNRLTMQASDRLYGVTMEKKGVSRLVTVRFEDFEQGRAAQRRAS